MSKETVKNQHGWSIMSNNIGSIFGSAKESDGLSKNDALARKREEARSRNIILSPKDIKTGEWDVNRVLQTTLDGAKRDITSKDLVAFRKNMEAVRKKFNKELIGIKASQIIDNSTAVVSGKEADIKRAIREITLATPISFSNGKVRFITNASKNSKSTRHHVTVVFLEYQVESILASSSSKLSAQRLRKGNLRIECDCGRWRFWFRYIATIGNFNAGRKETGHPKIRNPLLKGVACKHLIRVSSEIQKGGAVQVFLAKAMEKAKNSAQSKSVLRVSQKEADRLIKNQKRRTTGNDIKTSEAKALKRLALKSKTAKATSSSRIRKGLTDSQLEKELRIKMSAFGVEPNRSQIKKAILTYRKSNA